MDSVMHRASIIAQDSAQRPVAKVWVSKWVRSGRERGVLLTNPYLFAVYYRLPEDDHKTPGHLVPTRLEVTAEELWTMNSR